MQRCPCVVTSAAELSRFIADAFPGASLPPLHFDSCSFLRFELGGEIATSRAKQRRRRVEQAVARAAAIFEEAVPSGHRGWLDAYLVRSVRSVIAAYDEESDSLPPDDLAWRVADEHALRQVLPAAARGAINITEVSDLHGEDEDEDDWISCDRLTSAVELRTLDYRTLFQLIANHEMGIEPWIGSTVFLVDETDPLVFKMYDDRGAILHAPNVRRLRGLYDRFGDWLVDSWRADIDAQFIDGT
jgi:hypothetical protein